MAGGVNRKISAASARAHTRKSNQSTSFNLPPGVFQKILAVLFVEIFSWIYQAIQPPPPRICGSPNGPTVTAPRTKLRDGRYSAYKEHGVPRDVAKYKIIYVHGFNSVVEELGIYIVSLTDQVMEKVILIQNEQ
ncbi:uncharacterized protein LOC110420829 isoform X2 [Herrania umbratica]|uniref:Uncharacterized protein LOC110420829 isoform X2 n=1 Tax=Herrania umbratica TaxID=108875 RepID=A0A6J1ASM4_9ROSI|nr:uncharacterized protein LOC110420829 isoform X2 [Herrania umbratica]